MSTVALAAPTLSTLNEPVDVLFKNVGGNCTVEVLKVNTGLAGIGSTLTSSIVTEYPHASITRNAI